MGDRAVESDSFVLVLAQFSAGSGTKRSMTFPLYYIFRQSNLKSFFFIIHQ